MSYRKGSRKSKPKVMEGGTSGSDIRRFFIYTNSKPNSADMMTAERGEDFACDELGMGLVRYPTFMLRGPDSFSLEDFETYQEMDQDVLREISSNYWCLYKGRGGVRYLH